MIMSYVFNGVEYKSGADALRVNAEALIKNSSIRVEDKPIVSGKRVRSFEYNGKYISKNYNLNIITAFLNEAVNNNNEEDDGKNRYEALISVIARNGDVCLENIKDENGNEFRDHCWLNPNNAGEGINKVRDKYVWSKIAFKAVPYEYQSRGQVKKGLGEIEII
jgi:hypothetical protein